MDDLEFYGRYGRPRDLAITDIGLVIRPDGMLRGRGGRYFVCRAGIPRARTARASIPTWPAARERVLEESVSAPARRLAEWGAGALCGVGAFAVIWLAFVVL
jgi:hypothetical protein